MVIKFTLIKLNYFQMKPELMNMFERLIDSSDLDWEWFYV